jgi:hypothetical protein
MNCADTAQPNLLGSSVHAHLNRTNSVPNPAYESTYIPTPAAVNHDTSGRQHVTRDTHGNFVPHAQHTRGGSNQGRDHNNGSRDIRSRDFQLENESRNHDQNGKLWKPGS